MSWNTAVITNPYTNGRGPSLAFAPDNANLQVTLDEYDGHGVTVSLGSDDFEMLVGDTDEGCFVQIRGLMPTYGHPSSDESGAVRDGNMIMVCLPTSVLGLLNALELAIAKDYLEDDDHQAVVIKLPIPAPDAHLDDIGD